MPEQRLERTRATLPPEYQFGDAALRFQPLPGRTGKRMTLVASAPWRPMHENAAERLQWNTIEPD